MRTTFGWVMATLLSAGLWASISASAMASEVRLYANANCTGSSRFLIENETDLDRTDFGNAAVSVRVLSGTWMFFRDDNFQSDNGPPITLEPGGCVNMGQGPAAAMPPALMDSVAVVQAGPGPEAAIVLWSAPGLQGTYRALTTNAPDLDLFGFDNATQSFQVLAGNWRVYPDDGFQTQTGPYLVAAGAVADITQAGFPANAASSVQLLGNDIVVPPPQEPPVVVGVECPVGSASNGRSCVDCVGSGLVVADNGGACVCPPGQQTLGSRVVNGIQLALCQRELAVITPPQPPVAEAMPVNCSGNQVAFGLTCVPCPQGAEPNAGNTQCVCSAGYQQAGTSTSFGHPVCIPNDSPNTGSQTAAYAISGEEAYEAASAVRFRFTAEGQGLPLPPTCRVGTTGGLPGMTMEYWPGAYPNVSVCSFGLFLERRLQPGWEFVTATFRNQLDSAGNDPCTAYNVFVTRVRPNDPRDMSHTVEIHHPAIAILHLICSVELTDVVLNGPADADWRDAFN